LDLRLFHILYASDGRALTWIAAAFSVLGSGWITLALLPLLAFRRHRASARALAFVLAFTAFAVAVLKLVVHRVRPCHALSGVQCLWGAAPTDFSFPSGHAAGSFAFAAFVGGVGFFSAEESLGQRSRAALCVAVFLVATCIALSRVYLGVHFPGDVAAGSVLGAAIGFVGARAHLRRGSPRGGGAPSPQRIPR
jgi:undecaprenyl-diphosphatase